MKLLKEPRDIDFSMRSGPWKEEDLAEFRLLMVRMKKEQNPQRLEIPAKIKSKTKIKDSVKAKA